MRSRIVTSIILLFSIMNILAGCGGSNNGGYWKVAHRADWEARFYDVFFIDEQTGWAMGNNESSTFGAEVESVIAHATVHPSLSSTK